MFSLSSLTLYNLFFLVETATRVLDKLSTRVYALRVNRKRQFQVRRLAFQVYENMKELFHLTTILELRTTTFDFRMATKIPIFTRSLKLHLTERKRIG